MVKRISLIALLMLCSSVVLAQYDNRQKERSSFGSRDGRFEASVILAFQTGMDESSEGGSSLEIDSATGWGVSFGWNWTARLNLQYRLLSTSPKYAALIVPEDPDELVQSVEHKMSKYSHQLNATYHFMKGPFTPFVVGGIGYGTLDSNIASEPPTASCWWDPWWGYICHGEWKTFKASEFTYNIGVGLRWDINNAIYSRAVYSREFMSLKNGTLDFDTATLEVGLMF